MLRGRPWGTFGPSAVTRPSTIVRVADGSNEAYGGVQLVGPAHHTDAATRAHRVAIVNDSRPERSSRPGLVLSGDGRPGPSAADDGGTARQRPAHCTQTGDSWRPSGPFGAAQWKVSAIGGR